MIGRFALSLFVLLAWTMPASAGTWGYGAFENDHALDWVYDVDESGTVETVRDALNVPDEKSVIEAYDAEKALVAAEIIAASLGKSTEDFPDELKDWLSRQPLEALQALAPAARSAIARVVDPKRSELYGLWADQDDAKGWLSYVAKLKARLGE